MSTRPKEGAPEEIYWLRGYEAARIKLLAEIDLLEAENDMLRVDRDNWKVATCECLEELTQMRLTLMTVVSKAKEALIGAKFWTQDTVMGQLAVLVDTIDAKMREKKT